MPIGGVASGRFCSNLFIYQARESSLVPIGFSDSPDSVGNINYETFVMMGELGWGLSALLAWKKRTS